MSLILQNVIAFYRTRTGGVFQKGSYTVAVPVAPWIQPPAPLGHVTYTFRRRRTSLYVFSRSY